MSTAVMTTETIPVNVTPITDPAALKGSSTDRQFVSDWVFTSNSTNHNLVFEHKLGRIPTSLLVLFSADRETVFPLLWPWIWNYSGDPVSIWMDDKTVTLSIHNGSPLHGWWDGNTATWKTYTNGYFRVIASV